MTESINNAGHRLEPDTNLRAHVSISIRASEQIRVIEGKLVDIRNKVSLVLIGGQVDGVQIDAPLVIRGTNAGYKKVNGVETFYLTDATVSHRRN